MIWVGRKTYDLVGYVKVNWHHLTKVRGQSGPKLVATLFVCLSYARNRSLDRDLFCVVSSARLPSAIHILRNSLLLRTMTEISISSGQSRIQRHKSDTHHIVTSLNLKEIITNYNTWNHLTVDKLISSLTLLNINILHTIRLYLNMCKQMPDVKLLQLHSNSRNYLTIRKQMRKSKWNDSYWIEILEIIWLWRKISSGLF